MAKNFQVTWHVTGCWTVGGANHTGLLLGMAHGASGHVSLKTPFVHETWDFQRGHQFYPSSIPVVSLLVGAWGTPLKKIFVRQ